jgi:hypothetical protein
MKNHHYSEYPGKQNPTQDNDPQRERVGHSSRERRVSSQEIDAFVRTIGRGFAPLLLLLFHRILMAIVGRGRLEIQRLEQLDPSILADNDRVVGMKQGKERGYFGCGHQQIFQFQAFGKVQIGRNLCPNSGMIQLS